MENTTLLETIDLRKHFGDIKAVDGIFLSVEEGQRHAIIGPNGAGKTTFFHLISGRYKPTRGNIKFKGRDITGMSPHHIYRRGLARSFQIINVFPGLSVFENVRSVLMSKRGIHYNFVRNLDRWDEIIGDTLSILERIKLADKRDERAGYLSYGDQRALEVGLTIASDPDLILLDEPTAGLSMEETRQALAAARGRRLLLSTGTGTTPEATLENIRAMIDTAVSEGLH